MNKPPLFNYFFKKSSHTPSKYHSIDDVSPKFSIETISPQTAKTLPKSLQKLIKRQKYFLQFF
jgi:hypothetical protein